MAKILVIEDDAVNVEAAKTSLVGHEITIAQSIQEAFDILVEWKEGRFEGFDIVMTDVNMPRGNFGGYEGRVISFPDNRPDNLPAGMAFALGAANLGAKVAILSDRDHHKDYVSALLDLVANVSRDNKSPIRAFFAPKPKNWGLALAKLSGEGLDGNENYLNPLAENQ